MQIIGLVIHLARATARRPVAERLVTGCGVPARLLQAVDGREMAAKGTLAALALPKPLAPRFPFPMGPGEYGCFLSHRRAWEALLASEAEAALILEDDVALGPEFPAALRLAVRHVADMGYVQLQTRPVEGSPVLDSEGPCRLYRPVVTPLRTSGQLVHRDAAARLLALSGQFDRPVDGFLQMHWLTGIRAGSIAPSGLGDVSASAGGSTLKSDKTLGQKLVRQVHRLRYRRAIRRASEASAGVA